MKEIENTIEKAAKDPVLFESLVEQHDFFILKCACEASGKYVSKSDDYYSIALIAFSEAASCYSPEKGQFLSFARMVIHRRIVDHMRSTQKYKAEIPIDPYEFQCEYNQEQDQPSPSLGLAQKLVEPDSSWLKLEIQAASQTFSQYGFSFFDLTSCSPRSIKTKCACAKAILYLAENEFKLEELRRTQTLPIKNICLSTGLPRKVIERHRKYIIAATEIVTGDYPCLAQYIQFIGKEQNK